MSNSKKTKKEEKDRGPKFSEAQKLLIIQWIAEGLTTKEMNEQAARLKSPFQITAEQAYYYQVTRSIDVKTARKARESRILNTGFAMRENRVKAINELIAMLLEDYVKGGKMWLDMIKGVGSGPDFRIVDYKEFNKAQLEAIRGFMDDIAHEVNGRVKRTDITSKNKRLTTLSTAIPPAEQLKDLTDDELKDLDRAAEIIERLSYVDEDTEEDTASDVD